MEHSVVLLIFIRLPFGILAFVFSILGGRFTQVLLYALLVLLDFLQRGRSDLDSYCLQYRLPKTIHIRQEILLMVKLYIIHELPTFVIDVACTGALPILHHCDSAVWF